MTGFLQRRMMTLQTGIVGAIAFAQANGIDVIGTVGGLWGGDVYAGGATVALASIAGGAYQNWLSHANG